MLEFCGFLVPLVGRAADLFVARRLYAFVMALLSCHVTEHKFVNVDPRSQYSD
jgi:hypothetical protein